MRINIVFLENLSLLPDPEAGENPARARITDRQSIFCRRQSRQSCNQNQAQPNYLSSFVHLVDLLVSRLMGTGKYLAANWLVCQLTSWRAVERFMNNDRQAQICYDKSRKCYSG